MILRLRLVDAVAIAAGAMLCLKVLGIASGSRASDATAPRSQAFGSLLSHARTNFEPDIATTGTVVKEEDAKPAAPAKTQASAQAQTERAVEPVPVQTSGSERALLERLGERREEWQQKGKDLELRERLIENAERKLEARINDLKAIEEKSEAAATKRGDTEAGALKNLVTMYETMKPKEAARVFDRLSHDVLVPVVLMMNPRKMAEILAVMAPEAAERLTVALATRARTKGDAAATKAAPGLPPSELPAIDQGAAPQAAH
jgi:flagellar motility protein MotE (MotC chaperone)